MCKAMLVITQIQGLRSIRGDLSFISHTNPSVSFASSNNKKTIETQGPPGPSDLLFSSCFRVVCHGNKTRRMSVWNNFSNE